MRLSDKTELFLKKNNLTIDSAHQYNYPTLMHYCHDSKQVLSVVEELQELGVLRYKKEEMYIYNLPLSTRLFNCLRHNKLLFLTDLEQYTEDEIFQIRHIGVKTMRELREICDLYGVSFQKDK